MLKYLFFGLACSIAQADVFFPTTTAELIAAINQAKPNQENDLIDLGGNTFILSVADNSDPVFGPNGLPQIKQDVGLFGTLDLTIQNGVIERDNSMPNLQLRHFQVLPGAILFLNN